MNYSAKIRKKKLFSKLRAILVIEEKSLTRFFLQVAHKNEITGGQCLSSCNLSIYCRQYGRYLTIDSVSRAIMSSSSVGTTITVTLESAVEMIVSVPRV